MNKWVVATAASFFAFPLFSLSASATVCTSVAACVLGANLGSGIAVEGQGTSNFGVFGVSNLNHGVDGRSNSSFGVVGITYQPATGFNNSRVGVLGEDGSTNNNPYNSGVAGVSPAGLGVYGQGGNYGGYFTGGRGVYAYGGIDAYADYSGYPQGDGAIRSYGVSIPFQSENDTLFNGVGCTLSPDTPLPSQNNCSPVATIDANGVAYFAGGVTSAGSATYRTKTSTGQDVAMFGSRQTSPTVEDLGKATLHDGSTYVRLEPTFSSAIRKTDYMVFLTPEGNSHGLYTSHLTSSGFSVKENDGGRSSLVFDYRIVAQPGDTKVVRLPLMAKRKLVTKHKAALPLGVRAYRV